MPTLTTEIFAIPIEQSKYIVYAPKHRTAFVANEQTILSLWAFKNDAFEKVFDPDGSLLDFLQKLGLIDAGGQNRSTGSSNSLQPPVSLTLVLETSQRNECSCCRPHVIGTNVSMSLTTAKQAIDLAMNEATKCNAPYLEIEYHVGNLSHTSRELINESVTYAKLQAKEFGLSLRSRIWTGYQLDSEQLDWIGGNIDEATIWFERVLTVHEGSELLELDEEHKKLMRILDAFEMAGLPHAVRLPVALDQISHLTDSVRYICRNATSANLYVEPIYSLQPWQGHPSQETEDFIGAFQESQRIAAAYRRQVVFAGTQLQSKKIFCSAPENNLVILPDGNVLTADKRFSKNVQEYLYIAAELTKNWLLEKIGISGGLVWQAPEDEISEPTRLYVDERNHEYIKHTLPQFALTEIPSRTGFSTPGFYPVITLPWERKITRRSFLGVCLGTSVALLLHNQSRSLLAWTDTHHALHKDLPTTQMATARYKSPTQLAATWVDPRLLSMTGIAANVNDSIEAGFHLRWFVNLQMLPDTAFPHAAFPDDPELIEQFVSPTQRDPDNPSPDPESIYDMAGVSPDWQPSPAFYIYRREHYPHYDNQFDVTEELLAELRQAGEVLVDSIQMRFKAGKDEETIIVKFLQQGNSPRTVHFLWIEMDSHAKFDRPRVFLAGYADEDTEPNRKMVMKWEPNSSMSIPWKINTTLEQGHYDELHLTTKSHRPFTLRFSYMDEDTKLANDPNQPEPGDWIRIAEIPFFTKFRSWQEAKAELFPHTIRNRYLDFSGDNIENDPNSKLDIKYGPLFKKLQQAFIRTKHIRNQNKEYLSDSVESSLAGIEYQPEFFVQLWSLDPNIATLSSQYYRDTKDLSGAKPPISTPPDENVPGTKPTISSSDEDVPGTKPPAAGTTKPELGSTYDYMITTAWLPPAKQLCYITQKVSMQTTPPMIPLRDLAGTQLEGVSREGGRLLYRAGLNWRIESVETEQYGLYEPPLVDVRRGGSPDANEMELITHYVDPTAAEEERVVDIPNHVPQSVPYPTTQEDRENFTVRQLDALDLEKTLQTHDSNVVITYAQLAAYREMLQTPIDQFFTIPEPEQRFNEFLPVDPTGSRTVYYDVRPIDLFGRVGDWHGPVPVKLKAYLPPPEAVNVTAHLKESGALVVSWRLGSRQLRIGTPVDCFNILWKLYDPQDRGERRRYELWKDQSLRSDIAYDPPTTMTVVNEQPLAGSSITGRILGATASTAGAAIAVERALLGPEKRIVTLTTDQCFWGVLPFVGIPARYSNSENLLDEVQMVVAGQIYDVIALECEETLRVSIPVPSTEEGRDPAEDFLSSLSTDRFSLQFRRVKETFGWSQVLNVSHFPEIGTDPELSRYELEQQMITRQTLRLRIPSPFGVEITERASWLVDDAYLTYRYEWGEFYTRHVPIRGFSAIQVSHDALRFGKAQIDSENLPVQTITIANGGLSNLVIKDIASDDSAFIVQTPSSATIAHNNELKITVAFNPTSPGDVTATLSVSAQGWDNLSTDTFHIPLSGIGVDANVAAEIDPRPAVPRIFLAELELSQEILNVESGDDVENPVPVIPGSILSSALSSSNGFRLDLCEIRLPQARKVTSKLQGSSLENIGRLLDSRGGELTFVDTQFNREYVCEVLSQPSPISGNAQQLSFLLRPGRSTSGHLRNPRVNERWTFYPVYRAEIDADALPWACDEPSECTSRTSVWDINIAVSTHKPSQPDGDSNEEQSNTVSAPVRLTIPPIAPEPPDVAGPTIKEPWVDPFETAFTTLPKILDNRKVVQYKLRLDDPELMSNQIPTIPANGTLEILRVPEDGLRAQILTYLRLPMAANPQDDVGYQEIVRLTDDPELIERLFDSSSDVRYKAGFSIFSQLNAAELYQAVTSWLIRFWDYSKYSLKNAFQLAGKITTADKPYLIDELEGTAAGNIFYAVRATRQGAEASELKLLPLRVVIPDTTPPSTPSGFRVIARDGAAVIQWRADTDPSVTKFRIDRAFARQVAMSEPEMDEMATIDVASAQENPAEHFAPLTVALMQQSIQVINETGEMGEIIQAICPWFAPPDFHAIRGVYHAETFDSQTLPLTAQSGANYFDGALEHYDKQQGKITGLLNLSAENGESPPLVVVYAVKKTTSVVSPHSVVHGTVVLPRIRDLLGIYYSWQFDSETMTTADQSDSNLLDDTMRLVEHHITDVPILDGELLSVVFRDENQAIASIEDLPVQEERLWLPFGPNLLDVVGIYRMTDVDQQDNLMQSGATFDHATGTITNVDLPDGELVLLVVQTEVHQWSSQSEFNAVELPSSLQDRPLSALISTENISDGVVPDPIPPEVNMLPQNYTRIGNMLYFTPSLPHGLKVTIVSETDPAERMIVATTDRVFQHIDQNVTPGNWRYRLVSVKTNEIGRMLESAPAIITAEVDQE